jgi:hypothetical protein
MILDRTSLRESLVMILDLMPNSSDKSKIIKCGLGALLTKPDTHVPCLGLRRRLAAYAELPSQVGAPPAPIVTMTLTSSPEEDR